MDILIPIIIIVLGNITANYLCENKYLFNYLKKKIGQISYAKILIITFCLAFSMTIVINYTSRLGINKEAIEAISLFIFVMIVRTMDNFKRIK